MYFSWFSFLKIAPSSLLVTAKSTNEQIFTISSSRNLWATRSFFIISLLVNGINSFFSKVWFNNNHIKILWLPSYFSPVGTIYNGIVVFSKTLEATVPKNILSNLLWLCVPITITSAFHSSAYSKILLAVSPSAKWVETLFLPK